MGSQVVTLGRGESLSVGHKLDGRDQRTQDYQCPCIPSLFQPGVISQDHVTVLDHKLGVSRTPSGLKLKRKGSGSTFPSSFLGDSGSRILG